jgi:hypothetical protein
VPALFIRNQLYSMPTMNLIDLLSDEELTALAGAASRLPDAPAKWVEAAVALWKVAPRPAAMAPAPTLWTRIAAALSFDSWATPPLALGVRSMAVDSRHLLYSAQGRDIDVRIAPAADRFAMAGQILGPDETGEVELAGAGAGAAGRWITHLDPLGEFRLDGIDRGTYQLTLRLGGDEIVLPPIVIGERVG